MNRNTPIRTTQFTAIFLLVVFLFIHAAKALHVYHHPATAYAAKVAQEIKQVQDCTLCDFHFSKDCDGAATGWQQLVPVFFPELQSPFICCTTASIGLVYADRGPPARA